MKMGIKYFSVRFSGLPSTFLASAMRCGNAAYQASIILISNGIIVGYLVYALVF